jgi:hypothetical protein
MYLDLFAQISVKGLETGDLHGVQHFEHRILKGLMADRGTDEYVNRSDRCELSEGWFR